MSGRERELRYLQCQGYSSNLSLPSILWKKNKQKQHRQKINNNNSTLYFAIFTQIAWNTIPVEVYIPINIQFKLIRWKIAVFNELRLATSRHVASSSIQPEPTTPPCWFTHSHHGHHPRHHHHSSMHDESLELERESEKAQITRDDGFCPEGGAYNHQEHYQGAKLHIQAPAYNHRQSRCVHFWSNQVFLIIPEISYCATFWLILSCIFGCIFSIKLFCQIQ